MPHFYSYFFVQRYFSRRGNPAAYGAKFNSWFSFLRNAGWKMAVCFGVICNVTFAQPGAIDFSFNVETGANNFVRTISTQSDGKIIICGAFTFYNGVGANRITRLLANGNVDNYFYSGTGLNNTVWATTIQDDDKILVGGYFTSYNGIQRNRITRLNSNGLSDTTFNPGTGANNNVSTISIQNDGKIIVGGTFTVFNGISKNYITRLNYNGSVDTSFNLGIGANDWIYTTSLQNDGKIIVGGRFTSYNGTPINRICQLNSDGSLDTTFNQSSGTNDGVYATVIQNDGKIIIGGFFTTYNGTGRNHIARINSDGSLDTTFNPGFGTNDDIWSIALQNDNKIIITGLFTSYNGVSRNYIARINSDGTLDTTFNPGTGADYYVYTSTIQNDEKIIIGGDFTSYNGEGRNRITRLGGRGISGIVFNDISNECIKDVTELGLTGRCLLINPGNIIVQTNSSGYWYLDSLPIGNYTITSDTSGNWQPTCPITQSFTVTNIDSITYTPSFGFISTQPCPSPDVSIHAPILQRCFGNQKIYVQACNQTIATGVLDSAYVDVELDNLLTVQSASLTYTAIGNNVYRFNVGTLNPGMCVNFFLTCSLSCNAVFGQSLCMQANLYPADSCVFDTIPGDVSVCNTPWDKSSLSVTGSCVNDSIVFVIHNIGEPVDGDMTCFSSVRVYIDGELMILDSIQLIGGDSAVFAFSGDGRTWRLEAGQHPLHPGNSHPNATVELCGDSVNWTPDLVNLLPMDDAQPVTDIYCGIVTGSYDPNDKTGFPFGVTDSNFISPNQQLQYLIRFQNTGTDTAFTVVIRDTLDMDLNIFSVIPGVASHNYTFKMYGPRVLEWTFNNILLPDSNVNEAASHGFVTFKVQQNPDLPNGTVINNSADIYFDFNAPVITNKTIHIVNDGLQAPAPFVTSALNDTACGSYSLNNFTYNNSGTYYQKLQGSGGADSIITLSLVVNQPTSSNMSETACNSYTLNSQTYTSSGTYTQTLLNAAGCDSAINLNLTILQPTSSTLTETACNSYTLNSQTYTSNGTYTQTLTNADGCDSMITLNLTILQPTNSTLTETACNSYTLNSQTYTSNGTYMQTLTNAEGCDSTIILNLTILQSTSSTLTETACNSYTLNSQTYTSSGTFTQTLMNADGCDSTITLNLIINQSAVSSQQSAICSGDSIFLQGNYQTTAGTYYDSLQTVNGCDSVVETILTVNENSTVFVSITDATCGTCNGSAALTVSGGTQPYSFQWFNGQDTSFVTGLCSGSVPVTITDANGCIVIENIIISNQSGPQSITISTTPVSCNGFGNGSANIDSINGGVSPFSYLWSNADTTPFADGLSGGNYFVTITDANGCLIVQGINISEPSPLQAISCCNDIICSGQSTQIWATASGGSGNYVFEWTGQTFVGTGPHNVSPNSTTDYCCTVTDDMGCTANACITIDVLLLPDISLTSTPDSGNGNGTATVVASGGTAPYGYLWSTLSGFQTLTGLGSGIYSVTVTDANGCETVDSVIVDFYSGKLEAGSRKSEVIIIPNPNGGRFELSVADSYRDGNQYSVIGIKIYNILGEEIYRILFTDYHSPITIDLGKAGSGMYYVQVVGENGVVTKKVIVE